MPRNSVEDPQQVQEENEEQNSAQQAEQDENGTENEVEQDIENAKFGTKHDTIIKAYKYNLSDTPEHSIPEPDIPKEEDALVDALIEESLKRNGIHRSADLLGRKDPRELGNTERSKKGSDVFVKKIGPEYLIVARLNNGKDPESNTVVVKQVKNLSFENDKAVLKEPSLNMIITEKEFKDTVDKTNKFNHNWLRGQKEIDQYRNDFQMSYERAFEHWDWKDTTLKPFWKQYENELEKTPREKNKRDRERNALIKKIKSESKKKKKAATEAGANTGTNTTGTNTESTNPVNRSNEEAVRERLANMRGALAEVVEKYADLVQKRKMSINALREIMVGNANLFKSGFKGELPEKEINQIIGDLLARVNQTRRDIDVIDKIYNMKVQQENYVNDFYRKLLGVPVNERASFYKQAKMEANSRKRDAIAAMKADPSNPGPLMVGSLTEADLMQYAYDRLKQETELQKKNVTEQPSEKQQGQLNKKKIENEDINEDIKDNKQLESIRKDTVMAITKEMMELPYEEALIKIKQRRALVNEMTNGWLKDAQLTILNEVEKNLAEYEATITIPEDIYTNNEVAQPIEEGIVETEKRAREKKRARDRQKKLVEEDMDELEEERRKGRRRRPR